MIQLFLSLLNEESQFKFKVTARLKDFLSILKWGLIYQEWIRLFSGRKQEGINNMGVYLYCKKFSENIQNKNFKRLYFSNWGY